MLENRWWVYQRERFPVLSHGILIAAFSFSALSFSALLRSSPTFPAISSVVIAFVSAFLFFLLLRIADEFKDYEDDCRFRSYRPVPRGLVTLRELGYVAAAAIIIQSLMAIFVNAYLIIVLAVVWVYLALMSVEFFVPRWLKQRPITYMWSHMLIMPLIDLYATACDWLVAGLWLPPDGLYWFLIVSFFNGIVIEIGRKIRAQDDEEEGVETYSFLWGQKHAVMAWLFAILCTAASALCAATMIDFEQVVGGLLLLLVIFAGVLALRFVQTPTSKHAKWIEHFSGIWTILMYLSLGVFPLLIQLVSQT